MSEALLKKCKEARLKILQEYYGRNGPFQERKWSKTEYLKLSVECPKCGAKPFKPCTSIVDDEEYVTLKNSHAERKAKKDDPREKGSLGAQGWSRCKIAAHTWFTKPTNFNIAIEVLRWKKRKPIQMETFWRFCILRLSTYPWHLDYVPPKPGDYFYSRWPDKEDILTERAFWLGWVEGHRELRQIQRLVEKFVVCIHALPPQQREVIMLRYGLLDGKERSFQDTGQSMLMPVTGTRVRDVEAHAYDALYQQYKGALNHIKDMAYLKNVASTFAEKGIEDAKD